MLLSLCGKNASGKGTIAKMLSEKLGYEVSSIGSMKRETAKEMGMTIQEFDNLSEEPGNAKKFDEKYENDRKSLNLQQNIILEARTGFYVQPKSFKVLLDVSKEEAGKRVFEAHRDSEVAYKTVEEAISATVLRQEKVETRLKKLYGIDIYEYKNFDLVIDTTERTPAEVFEIILNEFKTWKIKKLKSWDPAYDFLKTDEPELFPLDEQKALSKANHKKSLLKNILLLVALLLIIGFWIVTFLLSK